MDPQHSWRTTAQEAMNISLRVLNVNYSCVGCCCCSMRSDAFRGPVHTRQRNVLGCCAGLLCWHCFCPGRQYCQRWTGGTMPLGHLKGESVGPPGNLRRCGFALACCHCKSHSISSNRQQNNLEPCGGLLMSQKRIESPERAPRKKGTPILGNAQVDQVLCGFVAWPETLNPKP